VNLLLLTPGDQRSVILSRSCILPQAAIDLSSERHINGTHYVLAGVARVAASLQILFCRVSEMFGNANEVPKKESTGFQPRSPYGISFQ
jgi:GDP-D-mannose dehydratase